MNDYGPLMLSCRGTEFSLFDYGSILTWKLVNGYVLFKNNFTSAPQLTALTSAIQNKRRELSLPPALIAVDHEGGPVQRFVDDFFTKIPSAEFIGQLFLNDKRQAEKLIKDIALVIAAELGSCGINLLLGPVLDLALFNLKKRIYSSNPLHVIQLSSCFLQELAAHGFPTMAKHFPGLGAALVDTHVQSLEIKISYEEMQELHLLPFYYLIQQQLLSGVMLAHGTYSLIDSAPVPASSFWIEKILRERFQFDGLIMTDCLNMQAAQSIGNSISSRIINCIKAGSDIVLLSHVFFTMRKVIASLQSSPVLAEKSRLKNNQRMDHVIKNLKPLEYYLNLKESSNYFEAKKNILSPGKPIIIAPLAPIPINPLVNHFILIKKIVRRILLNYPLMREKIYPWSKLLINWWQKYTSPRR